MKQTLSVWNTWLNMCERICRICKFVWHVSNKLNFKSLTTRAIRSYVELSYLGNVDVCSCCVHTTQRLYIMKRASCEIIHIIIATFYRYKVYRVFAVYPDSLPLLPYRFASGCMRAASSYCRFPYHLVYTWKSVSVLYMWNGKHLSQCCNTQTFYGICLP